MKNKNKFITESRPQPVFTSFVGSRSRAVYTTGKMRGARKRKLSERRAAHTLLKPTNAHKYGTHKTSTLEWHARFILRCAKRGEDCNVRNFFK